MSDINGKHGWIKLSELHESELIDALCERSEKLKHEGAERYAERIEALEEMIEILTGSRQ